MEATPLYWIQCNFLLDKSQEIYGKGEHIMKELNILYEDEHIIVCEKPAGVAVQTKKFSSPDLESMLKNYIAHEKGSSGHSPYLGIVHRLDQPVGGILVFGKNPHATGVLSTQIAEHVFIKEYQAVVCGHPKEESAVLTDYLVKDGRTNTSRVTHKDAFQAKYAELSYTVSKQLFHPEVAVVKIRLKTGRHHQIRVQMANAGLPLWGDAKYNPDFQQRKDHFSIALCANHLCFLHPVTHKAMEFSIPCDWSCIF